MKLIVHTGTGTIIDADDQVFVLDMSQLTDEERKETLVDQNDDLIVRLAKIRGRALSNENLDMTPSNSITFTPFTIRYEIGTMEGLITDKNLEDWVLNKATDDELNEVGQIAISDEMMWENYSDVLIGAIVDVYNKRGAK